MRSLAEAQRGGVNATGVAAIVVVMIVVVVGVGAFFESQGPPVTSLTTAQSPFEPHACVFSSPPALQASAALSVSFSGCLEPGASGTYLIAATGQDRLNMTGAIASRLPVRVTIAGAAIGNLSEAVGMVYSANDTTSVSLPGVVLMPTSGYAVTVTNEGDQNATVSMDMQLATIS
jgi:hypothetical protein